jgi:hypothetical protein
MKRLLNRKMSKKNFQNEELDRVARDLLGAARVGDDEIEKIIAAPNLFASVKTRIQKERFAPKPKAIGFPVWNWQTALAILTLAMLGAAAAIVFKMQNSPQTAEKTIEPSIATPIAQPENPPQIREPEKTFDDRVQRVDLKTKKAKLPNRIERSKKVDQTPTETSDGEFYALALAGNWETDAENLRIVRTELSRSELFALGVNLPVENDTQKIKTDLLVGANGVPKAIRFVE